MVLGELLHWPHVRRTGPMIRSEVAGRPYCNRSFDSMWQADARAAGISTGVGRD
jgi:hypothetical protein